MKEYIVQAKAQETIDSFDAHNAPELIRCKDCEHGEPGACGYGIDCDGIWHNDDWFCADGGRKEQDK